MLNITTVGELRKALEKYSDDKTLEIIRIDDLSEEQQKEFGFKEAIIPHNIVDIRDDELIQENIDGAVESIVTIQIKEDIPTEEDL